MPPDSDADTAAPPVRLAPIRLAIVGCGAVSERFHVPALHGLTGYAPLVMVDRDPARAELLAAQFPGAVVETDYRTLAGRVDAAIVALPSNLNAAIATDLLRMGISVLVEKPAALTIEDATALAEAEAASGASLTVGFIRREAAAVRAAKACVESGMLGPIRSFSIEDGYPFEWSDVSDFRFNPARGGGILLDIGSHVLDLAAYWFGDARVTSCADDNLGGVETNVLISLETASGIPGTIEISWNRRLRNTARIVGEKGSIEVEWYRNLANIRIAGEDQVLDGLIHSDARLSGGAENFPLMFLAQLQRWLGVLRGESDRGTMASAAETMLSVQLLTQCRALKTDLEMPWRAPGKAA